MVAEHTSRLSAGGHGDRIGSYGLHLYLRNLSIFAACDLRA